MAKRNFGNGDRTALDRLTPLIYDELRRIARRHMRRERPGETLQTTALILNAPAVFRFTACATAYMAQTCSKKLPNAVHHRAADSRLPQRTVMQFHYGTCAARRCRSGFQSKHCQVFSSHGYLRHALRISPYRSAAT